MEFRAFVEVTSRQPRPAEDWRRLHETLEHRLSGFGPIMSYRPDRPGDNAEVTVSTSAAEPVDAGRMLTDAVYLAVLAAGLGDCYVSAVQLETVADDDLAATA